MTEHAVRETDVARRLEEAELSLAAAREDLVRADRYLRRFVGQVAHDLRTPLTAALANAEMLGAEPLVADDADLRWMADGAVRAVRRLDEMIEEMVRFADEEDAPTREQTSLEALVGQAVAELGQALDSVEGEVAVGPLPTLDVDPDRMYDVLLAVLGNAVKFARTGEPLRVRVEAERNGPFWRVEVTDNGIGVAPDRQEAMFVPFTRVDKRVEGKGLGLARVKRVVEAHSGRAGMTDAPAGGTTVWLELPAD